MSQVIVTDDKLKPKRERTRQQEKQIDRDGQFARWRRNDITGPDPVLKLVGLAVMPVVALWGILLGAMTLMLTLIRGLFRGLGKLAGGTRNLITGG